MNIRKILTYATLLLFLIAIVLLFIIGNSVYSGKSAKVSFINNSGREIKSATISVSGKSCSVKKLQHTGEMHCIFENLTDSSYMVEGTLTNGNSFKGNSMGYVTGGINFNDKITLESTNEVVLVQGINE